MATRRPLVLKTGQIAELPGGDTLPGSTLAPSMVQDEWVWAGAALNLSKSPVGDVLVFVAGALQIKADRTVTATQITALTNAQTGDTVVAYYWGE